MTYQDYLDNWEANYGESDTGEYGYYRYGKHFPVIVHRLSEEEFNTHNEALEKASIKFNDALLKDDGDGMDAALAEGFPHEIALVL